MIEFDILDEILIIVNVVMNYVFTAAIDPNNQDSVIMVLYNLLPVVGNNSISNESFMYLTVSVGCIVAYYKWFR